MNDNQKDIALELAVIHARKIVCPTQVEWARVSEVLRRFDAAADAPKRKYTVKDIRKPEKDDATPWWRIRCGEFVWNGNEWENGYGFGYSKISADFIYDGLVATGNVPEVGE